jgi:choline dehydrogenase-like flavoprotein
MEYDYVLVGGGSAGATLAARLSEDHNTTVCLVEAGGEPTEDLSGTPFGFGSTKAYARLPFLSEEASQAQIEAFSLASR